MKVRLALFAALFACLAIAAGASAQSEGLTLKLSRDWGYGGFGGDIQGTFSMKASGPAELARVEFYIDDLKIGEAAGAPFNLQFVTDDYPVGAHTLRAVGYTAAGQELRSQPIAVTFVSAAASKKLMARTLIPLLAVIGGAILLTAVVSLVTGRKVQHLPPGTPRRYPLGGGICPKCGRPVALQLLGLNMLVGKFQRCPYCGRWSVIRRASLEALRAAEQAESAGTAAPAPAASREEALRNELEESKYQDL